MGEEIKIKLEKMLEDKVNSISRLIDRELSGHKQTFEDPDFLPLTKEASRELRYYRGFVIDMKELFGETGANFEKYDVMLQNQLSRLDYGED